MPFRLLLKQNGYFQLVRDFARTASFLATSSASRIAFTRDMTRADRDSRAREYASRIALPRSRLFCSFA